MRKLIIKFNYYAGKFYKFFGICYKCGNSLNFTRHGQGICPNIDCRARY
jgi:hypothetical protein